MRASEIGGSTRSRSCPERRERAGVYVCSEEERYAGNVPSKCLYASVAILYVMRAVTGSQCSFMRSGEMC